MDGGTHCGKSRQGYVAEGPGNRRRAAANHGPFAAAAPRLRSADTETHTRKPVGERPGHLHPTTAQHSRSQSVCIVVADFPAVLNC